MYMVKKNPKAALLLIFHIQAKEFTLLIMPNL